jgi:hypothetical protein
MITMLLFVCTGLMFGQYTTITVTAFQDTSATDGIESGYSGTMVFGTAVGATDCQDVSLGETELPPPPPAGVFDLRFTDDFLDVPCMGQGQLVDYRAALDPAPSKDFTFKMANGDGTVKSIKLKWDKALVAAKWVSLVVTNDAGITFDMSVVDSCVFTRTQYLNKYMVFRGQTTGVREESNQLPGSFSLSQNYPNPFNPTTTIKFSIARAAFADIAVFDVMGRRIATLASEDLKPGFYSTTWNGTDKNGIAVSSGVYYVRMVANGADNVNFSQVQKLLLMK